MELSHLSDDELVSRIGALCLAGHRLTARLVVHLVEVEERRLDLREGYRSLFDFCTKKLDMSPNEAFRRINAARLVRRFPQLLAYIERGQIRITTLERVRDHLTAESIDGMIEALTGKTQREVREYLAAIAPQPDAPDRIVPLSRPMVQSGIAFEGATSVRDREPPLRPSPPAASGIARAHDVAAPSEDRFKIELTLGRAAKEKLERARDLMSHRNAKGDLATVLEAALDVLIAKLEKERLAKAKRPRSAATTIDAPLEKSGIPRAVRRAVFERDGEQCTFRSAEGRRCEARRLLELDHIVPQALGGTDEVANLRVRCRPHNRLYAEEVFGKERIEFEIERSRRQRRARVNEHFGQPKCEGEPGQTVEGGEQSPCDDVPARDQDKEVVDASDAAMRGLTNLGFTKRESTRALDLIAVRHGGSRRGVPLESLIREALRVLT